MQHEREVDLVKRKTAFLGGAVQKQGHTATGSTRVATRVQQQPPATTDQFALFDTRSVSNRASCALAHHFRSATTKTSERMLSSPHRLLQHGSAQAKLPRSDVAGCSARGSGSAGEQAARQLKQRVRTEGNKRTVFTHAAGRRSELGRAHAGVDFVKVQEGSRSGFVRGRARASLLGPLWPADDAALLACFGRATSAKYQQTGIWAHSTACVTQRHSSGGYTCCSQGCCSACAADGRASGSSARSASTNAQKPASAPRSRQRSGPRFGRSR